MLEVIYAREGWPKVIFEEHFITEDVDTFAWFMVKCVNHYHWLCGPMNHLPHE
jgi:hypothetical protein